MVAIMKKAVSPPVAQTAWILCSKPEALRKTAFKISRNGPRPCANRSIASSWSFHADHGRPWHGATPASSIEPPSTVGLDLSGARGDPGEHRVGFMSAGRIFQPGLTQVLQVA